MFRYGPSRKIVKFLVWLFWPVIKWGKKLSNVPVLKWLIYPFFRRPHNEVTSIPINVALEPPQSVPLPQKVVERLLSQVEEKFILHACICRDHNKTVSSPRDLGCIALGPAIKRMHPTNGRLATTEEAIEHARRAAREGLIPNIAHVWIDPFAYATRFHDLMFMCFCDDDNCLYRTYMENRGPSLSGAFKKLPGVTIILDEEKCNGCGECEEHCFVRAIHITEDSSITTEDCKGCGRCVEKCPYGARSVRVVGEDELFEQLRARIKEVSDLPLKSDKPKKN